jgi:RimJ/RimL family protein N-acetyltransferase
MTIETPRLRLRPLTDTDVEPCAAMLTDPDVMQYVSPDPKTRQTAEEGVAHYRQLLATKGFGWWAIDVKDGPAFAGVILLKDVGFKLAIEVGWLLPRAHWVNGYATEGARAALDYAFTAMKLDEVVALTTAVNVSSQGVMQRLGMTHDPADDFDHPQLLDSPLRRCVLYRMSRPATTASATVCDGVYITAPNTHGANSLSPKPSASLLLCAPDATRSTRSKISRPFSAIVACPSAIGPQLTSMSSGIRA